MEAAAHFSGLAATELLDVTDDLAALDSSGRWAVVITFEGHATLARFRRWSPAPVATLAKREWHGPTVTGWRTSLEPSAYVGAVRAIRERIAAGDVYQANLCRVLTAELPDPANADVAALSDHLARGNPAPHQGMLRLPGQGVHIACASPELYLRRHGGMVESSPIKGTGRTATDLQPKDEAENIMIVDLVRNDLSTVCRTGTVEVPRLLEVEQHPGLVHLVSTVSGQLAEGATWPEIFAGTFPPGSVTGAPKSSALRIIGAIEPVPRGPYCGAIGWVDADSGEAELAVGIRTFWLSAEMDRVSFGTGAGITWGSDAEHEWRETDLKASRLVRLASQNVSTIPDAGGLR